MPTTKVDTTFSIVETALQHLCFTTLATLTGLERPPPGEAKAEWHYVAVSSDSEQGTTLYLDGQIVGNIDEATTLSLKALTLGNYSNSSTGYDLHGAMDDFQIYDVAMNAQSISQQYALQSSDVDVPLYGMSVLLLGGLMLRRRKSQS